MLARNRTAPQSAEVTGCGAGAAFFITIAGGATAGAVSAWRPLCGELVAAVMTPLAPAQAQSFTPGGTNSTTTTTITPILRTRRERPSSCVRATHGFDG